MILENYQAMLWFEWKAHKNISHGQTILMVCISFGLSEQYLQTPLKTTNQRLPYKLVDKMKASDGKAF